MYKNVIAIFFLLCEIVSADCLLYESEAFAIEAADEYRRSCESYGGGGGVFSSSVSENTPNNTCGGYYVENAYVLRVSCNTCGSVTMQEELNANKEYCNALCKVAALSCMTPLNSWGSVLSGDATACGNDDASLPGCSESSSSESEESSSSEASSSSQAQSSSGAESSSSEVDESSSSEELESSSSEDDDSSSSFEESSSSGESSSSENTSSSSWHIFPCYKPDGMGGCKVEKYVSFEPLPMAEEPQLYPDYKRVVCFYKKDGSAVISFSTNIPMQITSNVRNDWCHHDKNDCGNIKEFDSEHVTPIIQQSFYLCAFSAGTPNGCVENYDTGLRITEKLKLEERPSGWFYPKNLTDAIAVALANEAIERAQAVEIYYDGKYVKTESYRQRVNNDVAAAMDDCIYFAQLYEKAHTSSSSYSSSSNSFSSSSEEKSSSSESSSSSEPPSSSSLSSSSEELSSSSEEIVVESSSVMPVDEPFVAGPDQVYTPDQIFSSGLQNMEPGACYSLNPDRGTIYGWNISYNASDSWWWRKVDCETGEKPVEKGIGNCAAFPGSKPDKVSACYAHNGSCYVCDNSKDYIDCNADWLWNYNFPTHSWFKQVDCYDPFEEEDFDGQCPDRFYLEKIASSNQDDFEMTNYMVDFSTTKKDYDALGRFLNGKRSKFLRTFGKRENKIVPISKNTFDVGNIIYIPVEKIGLSQNFLAKEGDECPDYPCGDLGKDYGVGKDVGVYCGHPCTKPNMENGFLRIEVTNKRKTGSCGKNNSKYTITFKLPATAIIKRKNEYHVAPIGYRMGNRTVTIDEYEAAERHEIGHMESYSCLEEKNMFKSYYEFVLEDVCEKNIVCDENDVLRDMVSSIKKKMDPKKKTGIDELVRYNNELWQRMCGWYHETFSHEDGPGGPGKPAELTCPSTNTLLKKKYDLTGCEVH